MKFLNHEINLIRLFMKTQKLYFIQDDPDINRNVVRLCPESLHPEGFQTVLGRTFGSSDA